VIEVRCVASEGLSSFVDAAPNLTGFWSRRIDDANRLVYEITSTQINIVSCRYHY